MRLVLAIFLAGCAHRAAAPKPIEMEPIVFKAQGGKVAAIVEASTLFADAGVAYTESRWDDALALYDKILQEFPESRYVNASLYNAGLAFEKKGDLQGAAERYRRLAARECNSSCNDILDALYRLGNLYAAQKNWPAAAGTWAQILERNDLSPSDRVEAMARRAEAQFELRDLGAAERTVRELQALVKATEATERLDNDFFVGMGAFYLAQIAHAHYRALPIRLPEKQMQEDLEAKARMLLLAQARYLDAIRVKNPEWATAAGYHIAVLYRELYDDIVGAPVPPELKDEAHEVYLEEVRKKVRGLLQRAIGIHEKNLLMAERVGVKNEWVRRSNAEMEQLKRLLVPGAVAPASEAPPSPPPPPKPKTRQPDETPRVIM